MKVRISYCCACGSKFETLVQRGPPRRYCDECIGYDREAHASLKNGGLAPETKFAEPRVCIGCRSPFIARLPQMKYCDLACFLTHRSPPRRKGLYHAP